jgi:hypothetical protein
VILSVPHTFNVRLETGIAAMRLALVTGLRIAHRASNIQRDVVVLQGGLFRVYSSFISPQWRRWMPNLDHSGFPRSMRPGTGKCPLDAPRRKEDLNRCARLTRQTRERASKNYVNCHPGLRRAKSWKRAVATTFTTVATGMESASPSVLAVSSPSHRNLRRHNSPIMRTPTSAPRSNSTRFVNTPTSWRANPNPGRKSPSPATLPPSCDAQENPQGILSKVLKIDHLRRANDGKEGSRRRKCQ